MHIYQLTIGRNCDSTPLDAPVWDEFQAQAYAMLEDLNDGGVLETHRGVSAGDERWAPEDSTMVTLRLETPLADHWVTSLRARVAKLAAQFGQDAIALTIGQSELVEAPSDDAEVSRNDFADLRATYERISPYFVALEARYGRRIGRVGVEAIARDHQTSILELMDDGLTFTPSIYPEQINCSVLDLVVVLGY